MAVLKKLGWGRVCERGPREEEQTHCELYDVKRLASFDVGLDCPGASECGPQRECRSDFSSCPPHIMQE